MDPEPQPTNQLTNQSINQGSSTRCHENVTTSDFNTYLFINLSLLYKIYTSLDLLQPQPQPNLLIAAPISNFPPPTDPKCE